MVAVMVRESRMARSLKPSLLQPLHYRTGFARVHHGGVFAMDDGPDVVVGEGG